MPSSVELHSEDTRHLVRNVDGSTTYCAVVGGGFLEFTHTPCPAIQAAAFALLLDRPIGSSGFRRSSDAVDGGEAP